MNGALVAFAMRRVMRRRSTWIVCAGWLAAAVAIALASKAGGMTSGADHVMRGSFATLVLPLLSYAVVGRAIGDGGLARTLRGFVALGTPKTKASAAVLAASIAASAIASAVVAASVVAFAHGVTDPPLAKDMAASFGVGALGGAAYGAFFSAGTAVGKGSLRGILLGVDWFLGGARDASALFTPRGHVLSLLGGPRCAELTPRASSGALVVLIGVGVALGVLLMSLRTMSFEEP